MSERAEPTPRWWGVVTNLGDINALGGDIKDTFSVKWSKVTDF